MSYSKDMNACLIRIENTAVCSDIDFTVLMCVNAYIHTDVCIRTAGKQNEFECQTT